MNFWSRLFREVGAVHYIVTILDKQWIQNIALTENQLLTSVIIEIVYNSHAH